MAYLNDIEHYSDADLLPIRDELSRQLVLAAQLIESDPDEASLILDGLIWELIAAHYLARNGASPSRERLLAHLDAHDPALARRVRLALRAPDARARLVHAQQLHARLLEDQAENVRMLAPLEAV